MAKKDDAPGLLEALGDWVLDKGANPDSPKRAADALLRWIVAGSSDSLRFATDEVLAYMQWVNRFAEAGGLSGEEVDS